MARRTVTTAATFAATAALLLTACGGGDDSSPDDIKGADKGSSSPSASASKADADQPDLSLPKSVDLVFDFDKPSDAKHAAALANAQNYIRAMYHGIVAQDPNDPAYQYYSGDQAAQYVKSQIQEWVKGGWTPTGTEKYYDEDISTLSGGKRVLVNFCSNQAKIYGKEIKTGKVLYTKESLDSYQKFSLLMVPSSGSPQVWKAQVIQVTGKAKECQA
ncbi:hypothetical protein [Streptomyces sporangiiformans]|uniref:Lipoprotein n=1 Tax=Streptomyces sporangiiformans TaxID=2315329 RepID=A0A505DE34_9ACTN|nr:hypothetical protein [Streptomyces sporangiiformans]TPQ22024.1 hypothetical protein FGD71_011515 [Streptomyces sporangiiformans]